MKRTTCIWMILLALFWAIYLPASAEAALKELVLPSGLRVVEAQAFERSTGLERVVLPENVTRIDSRAFAESSLREIVLPASLTFIASDAFARCGQLLAMVERSSYAERYCGDHGIATNFSVIPQTPAAPTVTASGASAILVTFSWPQDADLCRIWRAEGTSGAYVLCAELTAAAGATASYSDQNLHPGTRYSYRLENTVLVNGHEYSSAPSAASSITLPVVPPKTDYSDVIWATLTRKWGFTAAQAAGIMGNIYAECTYCPRNAQDDRYPGLDNGAGNVDGSPVYVYNINDSVGYGICQWTYPSRKQGLLNKARAMGTNVEDINAQLAFFKDELDSYMGFSFTKAIKSMKTLEEVCDLILRDFESPIGWESRVEQRRGYAREAYAMFAGK